MSYEKVDQGGYIEIQNPDGEVIHSLDKPYPLNDDSIEEAVLTDAGFSQEQIEALQALVDGL